MKGLGKLIGNELYKLWKQTFIRVIAIIVLAVIVIYPFLIWGLNVGISLLDGMFGFGENAADDLAYYEEEVEWYLEAEMPLEARYYTAYADACRYFADEVIAGDESKEWLYEAYGADYTELAVLYDAVLLVKSGEYNDSELLDSSYAYDLAGTYFLEGEYGEPTEPDPRFNANIYLVSLEEKMAKLKTVIANATVESYLADTVSAIEYQIANAQLLLAEINASLEDAPEDTNLLLDKSNCERYIAWEQDLLRGYTILVEKGHGPGTWQYNAVASVLSALVYENQMSLPVTEAEFASDEEYTIYYESYESYLEECETIISQSDEPIAVILYAVENEISLPYLVQSPTKLNVESTVVGAVQLLFYLALIIGGTIVANEYSRGTIRLLLIRPRTRTKILWSKLLAGGAVLSVLAIFALLWSTVWGICFYGVSDFFVPRLLYCAGRVIELPAILSYLGVFGAAFLRVLFFYCVAFFFSAVCKKSASAIILTFVVNGVLNTCSSVALLLHSNGNSVVKYLPFAYVDLSIFRDSLTDYYCSLYGGGGVQSVVSTLMSGSSNMTSGLLPIVGASWFILLGGLLVFFSILTFRRRQIKN